MYVLLHQKYVLYRFLTKISQTFALKELYDDVDEPVNELGEQQRSKRDSALNSSLIALSLLACVSAMTDGFAFIDAYPRSCLLPSWSAPPLSCSHFCWCCFGFSPESQNRPCAS